MLCLNKKVEGVSDEENATVQLTAAFVAVFMFSAIKQGLHFDIQASDIAPLLALGLLNTGIGCFLYFSSIGGIKVQTVAILGYLEPLSAIIFSFIFLDEQLLVGQIIGRSYHNFRRIVRRAAAKKANVEKINEEERCKCISLLYPTCFTTSLRME